MKKTFLKTIGIAAFAILLLAGLAPIQVSAQDSMKEDANQTDLFRGFGARALEGSWTARAQLRNCQNGAPIGNEFVKMVTFMQGGTSQEDSTGSAPLPRSSAHGFWKHEGEQYFSYALQFFRFNTDGTYHSRTVARWQVEMETENSYSAAATIEVYNPGGVLIANLCATETATRFE